MTIKNRGKKSRNKIKKEGGVHICVLKVYNIDLDKREARDTCQFCMPLNPPVHLSYLYQYFMQCHVIFLTFKFPSFHFRIWLWLSIFLCINFLCLNITATVCPFSMKKKRRQMTGNLFIDSIIFFPSVIKHPPPSHSLFPYHYPHF